MTVKIKNENLQLAVSSKGAEIQNLTHKGQEYLWQGDPSYWSGRAPILFPACGAFNKESYTHQGKEYHMPKHGFASASDFSLKKKTENSCTFLLKSNEDTKVFYPFDFEFEAVFALDGDKLHIDYKTLNTGTSDLFYAAGAHEAYACPEGIENYRLIFPLDEELRSNLIIDNALSRQTAAIPTENRILWLKEDYFEIDALIFEKLKSKSVILDNPNNDIAIKVSFEDFPHLLIWSRPGAPYICIEPWHGFPDYPDSKTELSSKQSMLKLSPGKGKSLRHTIEFITK